MTVSLLESDVRLWDVSPRQYANGVPVPEGPYQVFVDARQLAQVVGVSTRTIQVWQSQGRIPAAHLQMPNDTQSGRGRGRRFVRYDLYRTLRWLEGRRDD